MKMIKENISLIKYKAGFALLILFFSLTCFSQNRSIYSITCKDIQHNDLDFSVFQNRKVIVVLFDAGLADTGTIKLLLLLDTLYKSQSIPLAVVGIPISDNGTSMQNELLYAFLKNTLQISFPITEVSKAKKVNGNSQHIVCKWLSNSKLNGHFNDDTRESGQAFVINAQGNLYASVRTQTKRLTSSELIDILNKQ